MTAVGFWLLATIGMQEFGRSYSIYGFEIHCKALDSLFNVVLICVGKVTKNIQIMAHFGHKIKTDSTYDTVSSFVVESVISFLRMLLGRGPCNS